MKFPHEMKEFHPPRKGPRVCLTILVVTIMTGGNLLAVMATWVGCWVAFYAWDYLREKAPHDS